MPATATDIAAGTREAVIVTWSDPSLKTVFPSARDAEGAPSEGFFDDQTDAQAAIDQRGGLIGVPRRRFLAKVSGLLWLDPAAGIATATLVDGEQQVDGDFLIGRVELDLETETTTLELFG